MLRKNHALDKAIYFLLKRHTVRIRNLRNQLIMCHFFSILNQKIVFIYFSKLKKYFSHNYSQSQ